MPSPILGIPEVAPTQADKTTTINDMIAAVEGATQDQMAVDFSAGNVTLTALQFTRHAEFDCSGQTAARVMTTPNTKRVYVVRNLGTFDIQVKATSGTTFTVAAGDGNVLVNDGANNVTGFGVGGPGPPGSVWREGSGAPSNSLGVDGDFYLNGTSGDVYLRAGGAYTVVCNIRGVAGATIWNAGSVTALGGHMTLVGGTLDILNNFNAGTVSALGAGLALVGGTLTNTIGPSSWNAGTVSAVGANLSISGGTLTTTGVELSANKGAVNGYAALDSGGKVPLGQLPASIGEAMFFAGTWDASANSPTLANGTGTNGALFTVTTAGTTSLDGLASWGVGDKAVFDGTANVWRKIDGQAVEVISVAGRTGAIVLTVADISGLPWNAGTVTALGSHLTLSGGTLDAVEIWNAGSVSALGNGLALAGGTLAVDAQGTVAATATATVSPTGVTSCLVNVGTLDTTLTVSPGYVGQHLRLEILQGATAHAVAFDSTVRFGADIASFTASVGANKRDLVQLINQDGTHWMLVAASHGF